MIQELSPLEQEAADARAFEHLCRMTGTQDPAEVLDQVTDAVGELNAFLGCLRLKATIVLAPEEVRVSIRLPQPFLQGTRTGTTLAEAYQRLREAIDRGEFGNLEHEEDDASHG